MANRSERPTKTPEGLDFPYSHFGDPEARTQLLRDIADRLGLDPDVVLNMGSGYDITPSDAFPDARVVHVDLEPPDYMPDAVDIVGFLKSCGFEAYTPLTLPEDFKADLGIDILGPGIEPRLIKLGGSIISTALYVPEGMDAIGLVDSNEPPNIITEPLAIKDTLERNEPVHLVISRKEKE